MMLNGGEYGGQRILAPEIVAEMTRLHVPTAFDDDVGLGWELNQSWYMGGLNSPASFGHTGYTGTSIVVNPEQRASVVLLTNRVHPLAKTNVNTIRRQLADIVARALQ
jgi:CubicO group peptidase (beta-lactamase class C family)